MRGMGVGVVLVGMMACSGGSDAPPEAPATATPSPPPPPPDVQQRPPQDGALPLRGSLCLSGEQTLFSCMVEGSRLASLCGGGGEPISWLQFRLGRMDAMDMRVPQGQEGSLEAFRYGRHTRPMATQLGVKVSTGRMTVELSEDFVDGEQAQGVVITAPSGAETVLPCKEPMSGGLMGLESVLEPEPLWR